MNHESSSHSQPPAELIQNSIQLIQKLRAGVGQVFKDLASGENVESASNKDDTDSSSKDKKESAGSEKSEEEQQEKKKAILRVLKRSLETISHDFNDLEKMGGALTSMTPLCNVDYLGLDPIDKNSVMHTQLVQSYKWTNKMHDLANHAFMVLNQNSMKRTHTPQFMQSKKQKTSLPVACVVSPVQVDQVLHNLEMDKKSYPGISLAVSRPLGSSAVVQIDLKRTLKAVIVLRGLMIEWVKVKGVDETFKTEDGQVDIWSSSRYQVFQKITDHFEAASLHFYAPFFPEVAIKSFLIWSQSFSTLFSAACVKCGRHLQNNMPPTWRDYKTRDPYHDTCRM